MSETVAFVCNDRKVEVGADAGESLLSVLRERLGLVSVKDGCAPQGQCGCCTVLIDGTPRVACVTPVARVAGRTVTTLEGLDPETRDALVDAFVASGGSQCGFCTPGILITATFLLERNPDPSEEEVRAELAGNLCRCTGYAPIVDAILAAAETLRR
jgi:aerobic-type carbon monoxide dehydrogenase small subunit (CoxS/CutS family)